MNFDVPKAALSTVTLKNPPNLEKNSHPPKRHITSQPCHAPYASRLTAAAAAASIMLLAALAAAAAAEEAPLTPLSR